MLVTPGGGKVVIPEVLEPSVDGSNERVRIEYSVDSRVYGRMCIGPSSLSVDPFRAFSASKKLKVNDTGEPLGICVGSFVKKEPGKPLELKSASTITVMKLSGHRMVT